MFSQQHINELERCRHESLNIVYDIYKIKKLFRKTTLGSQAEQIIVTGGLDRRLVILIGKQNMLVSLNKPFNDYPKHDIFDSFKIDHSFGEFVHHIEISQQVVYRLLHPKILLISLCHPENFPFPRFALGISDIAEAIRNNFSGEVSLVDMQLDTTKKDVLDLLEDETYDIVGFSMTFGQQDILEDFLNEIFISFQHIPLIVIGGSLAVLNYQSLLQHYPSVIVALGEGELTMVEIVQFWHNLRKIENIHHIAYKDAKGNTVCTREKNQETNHLYIPALDLLENTLRADGVMQLETSRGCTNACSFCPRSHKGKWRCVSPSFLYKLMPHLRSIYRNTPSLINKVFLVDEEFIGYNTKDNIERAYETAEILHKYEFAFEISTRIDQVYHPAQDRNWHLNRMIFWKYLLKMGLEKVLFGIESGVNSILKRFNKQTTKEQNVYAIRILSACNIPVRYTYITFDPLMTMEELVETYKFQGRTDLLLYPLPNISEYDLYELVHNEKEIHSFKQQLPLYRKIPYMLVSLEGLLSSPYLKMAASHSLLGKTVESLGKRKIHYLNPQIGMLSYFSQLWIDRNFAFDYSLKSIMKIADVHEGNSIYKLRAMIKDASYVLLGKMLFIVSGNQSLISCLLLDSHEKKQLEELREKWSFDSAISINNESVLFDILELQLSQLFVGVKELAFKIRNEVSPKHYSLINQALKKWEIEKSWVLINED